MSIRSLWLLLLFLAPLCSGAQQDSSRNYMAVNAVPTVKSLVAASYEHIFGKGRVGLRFPLTMGFGNTIGTDEAANKYDGALYILGIDLNLYRKEGAFSPRRAKFHSGPSFEYAAVKYTHYSPYHDTLTNMIVPVRDDLVAYQFCVMYKAGLKINSAKHFFFSPALALGMRLFSGYDRGPALTWTLELSLGYRW